MNLPFFIARKYFFSGKKRSFINFISIISMIAVCVGTMALIIVLSVFNGLEELNRELFKAFDPDLKIEAAGQKSFALDSGMIAKIKAMKEVSYATEVIQDKALARNMDAQMVVVVKGVDSTFQQHSSMKDAVVDGKLLLQDKGRMWAFIGGGVYNQLGLITDDVFRPLELLYPKNQKLNVLNPEDNINRTALMVSGVFILEQQYDNLVYLPLELMEKLTGNEGRRTAIEITLKNPAQTQKVRQALREITGPAFSVKDRDEQNAALLKAIKIERIFIFIALFFIIGIASFNIFFALTMLVIDKRDDIMVLSAIGGDKSLVRRIFISEGGIISLTGAFAGLFLGVLICWSQMHFGWLKLGMEYALVEAYPVKIQWQDVLYSLAGVIIIALLASILPARKATGYMEARHQKF